MFPAARHLGGALTALTVIVFGSHALQAQGATVLMFYGGGLQKPVMVSGADAATFSNVTTPATIAVAELGSSPYVQVALYWGTRMDPANNGTPLADLKPDMAWQHGRLYPAANGKPAILLTTPLTKHAQPVPLPSTGAAFIWGGPVPAKALAVLQRLGIIR